MIAVDTTGAIIGEPPPALEAPPVDMVSYSRPKIIEGKKQSFIEKFINPDPDLSVAEKRKKTTDLVKNAGKTVYNAFTSPFRYIGKRMFPSYSAKNVEIAEYDKAIPENLKDNWITYADIPEEKDITLFDNHPKLKHWTWKALSWFPHRYNVALNSRDYHDNQIRSAKTNPVGKILDVPSYFGNALAARGLYYGNKLQDIVTDPVGTAWTDPVISKAIKNYVTEKVTDSINAYAGANNWLVPKIQELKKYGYTLAPSRMTEKEFFAWRHDLIEDGVKLILDDPHSTENFDKVAAYSITQGIKQLRETVHKKKWKDEKWVPKAQRLGKLIKAQNVLYRLGKSYENEYKRTHKMIEDEREKIMNDNFREKLEKNDRENPQGQTALLTAGATGFMGGGGGGGSVWGKWKRGRRQTWFNKYGFRTNRQGKVYHRYKRHNHYSWRWHY